MRFVSEISLGGRTCVEASVAMTAMVRMWSFMLGAGMVGAGE